MTSFGNSEEEGKEAGNVQLTFTVRAERFVHECQFIPHSITYPKVFRQEAGKRVLSQVGGWVGSKQAVGAGGAE